MTTELTALNRSDFLWGCDPDRMGHRNCSRGKLVIGLWRWRRSC
jgi:hypothetical protein